MNEGKVFTEVTDEGVKFSISTRKCKTKTSGEHKHCTMQPFDTAFGGSTGGQIFEWDRGSKPRGNDAFCFIGNVGGS